MMMADINKLSTLVVPATANELDATACTSVGSSFSPCLLVHPSSFTPQKDETGKDWYMWKGGYFKSVERYLGDVNLDDKIDVTDVMSIVDHILLKPLKTFATYNADMNGDGIISVTDVMMVVDIILNKEK